MVILMTYYPFMSITLFLLSNDIITILTIKALDFQHFKELQSTLMPSRNREIPSRVKSTGGGHVEEVILLHRHQLQVTQPDVEVQPVLNVFCLLGELIIYFLPNKLHKNEEKRNERIKS